MPGNKILPFPNRAQACSSAEGPSFDDRINEIRDALRYATAAMARSKRQVQVIHRILGQIEDGAAGDAAQARQTPRHPQDS